jgi:hypothetical protein
VSIKQIIQESINKNPVGLKEALEEELRTRVALALEAKMTEEELEENKVIKDLGQGIKISIDTDKSIIISDRTAPGGRQMVVLEPSQAKEMLSLVKANKSVKAHSLGSGIKITIDADGSAVISDSSAPGGRQMVVLEPIQVKEIVKLAR